MLKAQELRKGYAADEGQVPSYSLFEADDRISVTLPPERCAVLAADVAPN